MVPGTTPPPWRRIKQGVKWSLVVGVSWGTRGVPWKKRLNRYYFRGEESLRSSSVIVDRKAFDVLPREEKLESRIKVWGNGTSVFLRNCIKKYPKHGSTQRNRFNFYVPPSQTSQNITKKLVVSDSIVGKTTILIISPSRRQQRFPNWINKPPNIVSW